MFDIDGLPNDRQFICSLGNEKGLSLATGKEETTWINCTVWGKRADTAMQYLRKGAAITVAGRGKLRSYQKKDGTEGQNHDRRWRRR